MVRYHPSAKDKSLATFHSSDLGSYVTLEQFEVWAAFVGEYGCWVERINGQYAMCSNAIDSIPICAPLRGLVIYIKEVFELQRAKETETFCDICGNSSHSIFVSHDPDGEPYQYICEICHMREIDPVNYNQALNDWADDIDADAYEDGLDDDEYVRDCDAEAFILDRRDENWRF